MMALYSKTSKGAHQMLADLVSLSQNIGQWIVDLSDLKEMILSARVQHQQAQKTIAYLKSAGYLEPIGKNRCKLTDLAKISLLQELVAKRRPDGKLRIIIFDIPEDLKRNRDYFRQHLTNLGFQMEQRSVWYSKIPCEDLVEVVINYHQLNKHVALVVGDLSRY